MEQFCSNKECKTKCTECKQRQFDEIKEELNKTYSSESLLKKVMQLQTEGTFNEFVKTLDKDQFKQVVGLVIGAVELITQQVLTSLEHTTTVQ